MPPKYAFYVRLRPQTRNNQLATHFRTYFQMAAGDASALAGAFGLMNLFARSLGGISSDLMYRFFGFRGRIWAQFLALFFEAIFLFAFGNVDNSQPWYVALAVLVCFSLFVQMAEGTSQLACTNMSIAIKYLTDEKKVGGNRN